MEKNGSGCGLIKNAGGDMHAYLGHFAKPNVLKSGHNQGGEGGTNVPAPRNVGQEKRQNMRADVAGGATRKEAFLKEHPVVAAKREGRRDVKAARLTGRAGVLEAKATGGNVGAAREAKHEGVKAAKAVRRESVATAKANPLSAKSEHAAFGAARKSNRAEARTDRRENRSKRLTNRANKLLGRANKLTG